MDADTKAKITSIVKDMSSQGMSNPEIGENLRSMGIADADISEIMREIGGDIAPLIDEPVAAPAPIMPQEEHIERLHSTVGELNDKQDMQSSDLGAIRDDLESIKGDLAEIKPLLSAMKRLNESLIDINKKMLVKYGASAPAKKKAPKPE